VAGLRLLNGLVDNLWEVLHPLPDPDDGDPYARVNALTLLREIEGWLGDLREVDLVADRSVGQATVRQVEVALGLASARSEEPELSRDTLQAMLGAKLARDDSLRSQAQQALDGVKQLIAQLNDKLGHGVAPDLRPLFALVKAVHDLLPAADADADAAEAAGEGEGGETPAAGTSAAARKGLSGGVHSRAEAIRAIDMICKYLEQAEPTNPAQLFLRRAEALINHNFLQLMKVLAPDALAEVARTVGIDPDSIETPGGS
jgi:type VI secretion system protein ImpA